MLKLLKTFSLLLGFSLSLVACNDNKDKNDESGESKADIETKVKVGEIFGEKDKNEGAAQIIKTQDGGYVIVGYKTIAKPPSGSRGTWILKLDQDFYLQWDYLAWGEGFDGPNEPLSISESDDGYVMGAKSFDSNPFLLKLDSSGQKVWKTDLEDSFSGVQEVINLGDGYLLAGSRKVSRDVPSDVWVLKLDSDREEVWKKTFTQIGFVYPLSLIRTSDNHYLISGGENFSRITKINSSNGQKIWKTDLTANDLKTVFVTETPDNHYIAFGRKNVTREGSTQRKVWIHKMKSIDQTTVWEKTLGDDHASRTIHDLIPTNDNGYALVMHSVSKSSKSKRDSEVWKLDSSGKPVWQKTFGGQKDDILWSIVQTKDGSYLAVGATDSKSPSSDVWFLKLDKNGNRIKE